MSAPSAPPSNPPINPPINRRTLAAYWCNIVGTLCLVASVFIDHPLLFMLVVAAGVPLLMVGFLLYLWRVVSVAKGKGMFQ